MSKKSRITQANILAEQRYLSKKFLFEVETPQTTTQTSQPQQATTPTSQPPQTTTQTSDQPVDLKTLIDTQQIDLTDTTKNQQVLSSIMANPNYVAKIPDINTLKQKVNTAEFLPELSKHIVLSFKPERDKIDKQTVKGWEFGIGNDKFHADIVFDRKTGAPEELGVGTHAHIGNKNIGLNMGMKMPHQSHDSHSSVNTGYFNQGGQIKAGVTIPIGNSGGHHKKSHGTML
jgi:hypothetical protein